MSVSFWTCFVSALAVLVVCDVPVGLISAIKCREYNKKFEGKSNEINVTYAVYLKKDNETKFCGGALISDKYVLIAASCAVIIAPTKVFFDISKIIKGQSLDFKPIAKLIPHPRFNINQSDYHDIALVELVDSVRFTRNIRPACLSITKKRLHRDLTITSYLRQRNYDYDRITTEVEERPPDECQNIYESQIQRMPYGFIEHLQLCIHENKESSYTKDVPTSLETYDHNMNIRKLVGVVSIGSNNRRLPQIYTRVSSYVKWIESVIWPDEAAIGCSKVKYSN